VADNSTLFIFSSIFRLIFQHPWFISFPESILGAEKIIGEAAAKIIEYFKISSYFRSIFASVSK